MKQFHIILRNTVSGGFANAVLNEFDDINDISTAKSYVIKNYQTLSDISNLKILAQKLSHTGLDLDIKDSYSEIINFDDHDSLSIKRNCRILEAPILSENMI